VNFPILTLIAGANGSGKSTLTKWARAYFQQTATLDPDAIAVNLQARTSSELSRIEAGREVLITAEGFLQKSVSFSVETTLSGSTYLKMLADAKRLGYHTRLFYIGTTSLSINLRDSSSVVVRSGFTIRLSRKVESVMVREWLWLGSTPETACSSQKRLGTPASYWRRLASRRWRMSLRWATNLAGPRRSPGRIGPRADQARRAGDFWWCAVGA